MSPHKKPDLKAPRYRPTVSNVNTIKVLKKLKKAFPGKYDNITNKIFADVIIKCHENIQKEIFNEVDGFELPLRLGNVSIVACNSPGLNNIDFGTSNKIGQRVYHKNLNTDGKIGKIYFTNQGRSHSVQNSLLWNFEGIRSFKRKVKGEFLQNWKKYRLLETYEKNANDNAFYKSLCHDALTEQVKNTNFDDYNEFDID